MCFLIQITLHISTSKTRAVADSILVWSERSTNRTIAEMHSSVGQNSMLARAMLFFLDLLRYIIAYLSLSLFLDEEVSSDSSRAHGIDTDQN